MGTTKREATIEELLSDPMMDLVLDHSGTTADDVRALMHDAHGRLAMARAAESEQPDNQ